MRAYSSHDPKDAQWLILDPLIPEPSLDGKTVAVVRGRTAALFSMEYFGCCALMRHGPICLIAIHRLKPAADGSGNGYTRAS